MELVLQVILTGLLMGGIYALLSLGLTLVFGVIRIINFAHGEFLMLAMYATFWLNKSYHIDPYISLFIVTPIFFVFGVITYLIILKPILNHSAIMQVFATVGLSILFINVALFLWSPNYRTIETSYSNVVFTLGGISLGFTKLIAFFVALSITLILFVFLKYTMTGKAIRAIVQDRIAANILGIDVNRVYCVAMGIGIALVGAAGTLLMPIYYVFPTVGTYFVLISFVVVVLGGLGDMIGALFGGLIIGIIEELSGFFGAPGLKEAIYLLVFVIVLILRPGGLFGKSEASEVGMK